MNAEFFEAVRPLFNGALSQAQVDGFKIIFEAWRKVGSGNELTPAVIVHGHHVNLRAYGEFADQVTYGLPQEGDVFERTHILQIIQDLDFKPITEEGVPAGYEGPNGVRLFDPGVINLRARVWA
jgi:hypothetical protein